MKILKIIFAIAPIAAILYTAESMGLRVAGIVALNAVCLILYFVLEFEVDV